MASVTRPDTPAHRIVGSLVVNRDVWGRLGRFATGVIGVMAALDLSLNVALHARELVQAPEPSTSQQVIIQIYTDATGRSAPMLESGASDVIDAEIVEDEDEAPAEQGHSSP
jgi:hypothetical protein